LDKALAIRPNSTEALYSKATALDNLAVHNESKYNEAIDVYDKILLLNLTVLWPSLVKVMLFLTYKIQRGLNLS
jgi:hypothetical protein